MEEDSDEDGCRTPTSQVIRVSLDRPPPPPRKSYKGLHRTGSLLELEKNEVLCRYQCHSSLQDLKGERIKNGPLEAPHCGSSGKCSSCGELSRLRPGRTVCFRLDCALRQCASKLE